MKKLINKYLAPSTLAASFVLLTSNTSFAAWSFDIADGSAPNTIDFLYNTDAGDSINLSGYTFHFNYSGADILSAVETPPAPLSNLLFGPMVYDNSLGTANFTAASFGGWATLSSDTVLATVTFDNDAVVDWDYLIPSFKISDEALTASTGAELFASGKLTNSSAVPIPGAVWLLGSGLAGLVTLRRKNN